MSPQKKSPVFHLYAIMYTKSPSNSNRKKGYIVNALSSSSSRPGHSFFFSLDDAAVAREGARDDEAEAAGATAPAVAAS